MRFTNFSKIIGGLLFLVLTFSVSAQTKRRATKKKAVTETAAEQPTVVETPKIEIKKNARPEPETGAAEQKGEAAKTNARPMNAAEESKSVYFYEFEQPRFTVSKINIEHDENGKGKITFLKQDFSEPVSDPIQLSAAALERIKTVWSALNFLDSTADYQYEKDYSHLGNMTFTMKRDGKTRAAKFNWTENKDAKNLADEYRRIGQQFIWVFDINVARENQPLEAPRLMNSLDSLIKRNEVSDVAQMIPLLNELNNDERIPLIARNHAAKLVKEIEKKK
ncbi:MAG: hypothetical protein M3T96_02525 [Acidobacteriota bacterium]|nr:hypothetical protein [Acidobacteriota bacterium]